MSTQPQPGPTADHNPYYLGILHELIDLGADMARLVHAQAKAATEPPQTEPAPPGADTLHDLTISFDRITRAVRRTILLARHIAEPRPAPKPPRPDEDPAHRRTEARKRIIREVEDAIGRPPHDPATTAPRHAEFLERLESPDLEDEIGRRPTADIIADICRDLGLENLFGANRFKRRTPRDLEQLIARAAAPRPTKPYQPGPHGPDPGAPRPPKLKPPPDEDEIQPELLQLAKLLTGT